MAWQNMLMGPTVIGQDLPQVGAMLNDRDQQNRRNALIQQDQTRQNTLFEQGQQDRQAGQLDAQKKAELGQLYARARAGDPSAITEAVQGIASQHPEFGQFAQQNPQKAAEAAVAMMAQTLGVSDRQQSVPTSVAEYQFAQQDPGFAEYQRTQRTGPKSWYTDASGKAVFGDPSGTPGAQPYNKPSEAPDPASVETTANMIVSGQIPMLSGFVLKSPWGQAVVAAVGQKDPSYSSTANPTAQATRRAFTVGTEGKTVRSLNVAIAHIATLEKLATALGNGDIQLINRARQEYAKQTGSPAPTSFEAARDIVAAEVVKSVTVGGGALADRQEAQQQVKAAQSPAQLAAIARTWKELMAGQMGGLRLQYEQGAGDVVLQRESFDKMLAPATIEALSGMGGADRSAAPAAGGGEHWVIGPDGKPRRVQ